MICRSTDEADPQREFPQLLAETDGIPIVIVGGVVVPEKLRWVQGLGLTALWVDAKDHSGGIRRLVRRIYKGRIWGVVMLNELVGHMQSRPIYAACHATTTRYALGRKGGQQHLRSVFTLWEQQLVR